MVFLMRSSRDRLEQAVSWGGSTNSEEAFSPQECWALRRGHVHAFSDPASDLACPHTERKKGLRGPYLCVPMAVQSEVIGVLQIELRQDRVKSDALQEFPVKRQLAVALAERIGLALGNIRLRENLKQQTVQDPLTGLYNRRFLEESLNREIASAARKKQTFAVLMLDVDHFKRFNDTFGHEAGDAVLRSLSDSLRGAIRGSDVACRYGGEEFVILLPESSETGALGRAKNILELVRALQLKFDGQPLGPITVSIGVATFPKNGETAHAIIRAADQALYLAKGAGRDTVIVAGSRS